MNQATDHPDGGHDRDHDDLEAALTPSRRGWLLEQHLTRFHNHEKLDAHTTLQSRVASLAALHNGLHTHTDASPAYRLSVCQAVADDLAGGLEWLAAVDGEAHERLVIVTIDRLIDTLPDPRTAEGDGYRRARAELEGDRP